MLVRNIQKLFYGYGVKSAVFNLLWLGVHSFLMVNIILSIKGLVDELDKTKDIVNNLINSQTDSMEIANQLTLFRGELSHKSVKITGCGLFTLDSSLLISACHTTVTYLVILCQLDERAIKNN
ncbi:putative gustatory receptor 28b [Microplitis mediator]|uniref:putative gustatory receptor 28b n=1 Tax=Microplitis mediator TaxID=375433 RepID=UPI002552FBD1|nr:putative gustatory receptor 28b [Microplitis mediator]